MNRKLRWLHARKLLRAMTRFRLRKSTIYRCDLFSRQRQRVDSWHSCKTIARKSFKYHWMWIASFFLLVRHCVFSTNAFSLRVCVCWVHFFLHCTQYIYIDNQYQLKNKKWKNCRLMRWFVVNRAFAIERLQLQLHAIVLLWLHANVVNVLWEIWMRCKDCASRKRVVEV